MKKLLLTLFLVACGGQLPSSGGPGDSGVDCPPEATAFEGSACPCPTDPSVPPDDLPRAVGADGGTLYCSVAWCHGGTPMHPVVAICQPVRCVWSP